MLGVCKHQVYLYFSLFKHTCIFFHLCDRDIVLKEIVNSGYCTFSVAGNIALVFGIFAVLNITKNVSSVCLQYFMRAAVFNWVT